jgi:hypothetical protein
MFWKKSQFKDIIVQKCDISIILWLRTRIFDTYRVSKLRQLMARFTTVTLMKCHVF